VTPVVTAQDVVKRWGGTTALDTVTFTIGSGVTGLVGANGAGKTTLLSLLLGMHRPDSGSVSVVGLDPWRQGPSVRARVGYAPEQEALPEDVSAHDIVRHLAEVHGLPAREAQTRASDVLWELGMAEERFRPVGTMSTGQKQRVKLAIAIAHGPDLALLDEPTNGLDPTQREQMLALIRRVADELGIDVIVSSHLLEEVERVSDAVLMLDAGRVVRSGRLSDLTGARSNELLVELDDPADAGALAAALEGAGLTASVADGTAVVTVGLDDDSSYDVVRDTLAAAEFAVRRLAPRSVSLEDLFLAPVDD
jgi:ABC-2 type transport system ATP-binding protein